MCICVWGLHAVFSVPKSIQIGLGLIFVWLLASEASSTKSSSMSMRICRLHSLYMYDIYYILGFVPVCVGE